MSLTILHDLEQGTDAWLEARRGILTASVVGRLLTPTGRPANNDTSRGVIHALAAERITGRVEPTSMTPDMWRGVESEPFARTHYAAHHASQTVTEVGFMIRDDWGFPIGYSPDGLVGEDGAIEIKAPRGKTHLQTVLADEVPPYHMPQLQTGLLVSGRDWIDYVSFLAGEPLYIKRVTPDPAWQDAIVAAATQFEEAVNRITETYAQRTRGLPPTEPIPTDIEVVI